MPRPTSKGSRASQEGKRGRKAVISAAKTRQPSKRSKVSRRQKEGYKAAIKGLAFEKRVGEYVSKQGYTVSYEKPIGRDRFDILGKKESWSEGKSYFVVECKDKTRVTPTDILRFMRKLARFYKRLREGLFEGKPSIYALLAYTGELPKDAREAAKGFKPSIKFKKF